MADAVRFLSEKARHRMVRKPTGEQIMPNGTVAITTPEVVYEFENGGLNLRPGQDILPDGYNPETGFYEVEQDAISWLRSTVEFQQGTIMEITPEAPPVDPSVFVEIGRLEAAGDADGIVAIGNEENDGWARSAVLDACRAALANVEAQKPVKAKAA